MEAATAGAEAGQAEAAQEAGEAQPEEGAQLDQWQQNVDSRLGDAADSIRQMAQLVESRLPEPAAEPEPNFEDQFAELFGEDPAAAGIDPQALQQLVTTQAEAIAQKIVAPLQQQLGSMQESMTAEKLDALQTRFPELQDPKAVEALADNVVGFAAQLGVPQLANNPALAEMVHLAEKARASATQETPAGQGPEPHVEQGGGAAPASSEGDPWSKIANAGRTGSGSIW